MTGESTLTRNRRGRRDLHLPWYDKKEFSRRSIREN